MPSRVSAQQYGDWAFGLIYGDYTLKINPDGSINATLVNGDIQIGAVELKDATTNTRAKVKTDGVDNGLVVIQNSSPLPTGAATSDKQLADNHNVTVSNIASTPLVDVSSLATSANQLPDDHNVTVSNMIPAVETGLATSANQTDGSQKTQLVDSAGNVIESYVETDGNYHLGVSAVQHVMADSNNSSTTNLDAGNSYTFTGTGTSTLGVVGLQFNLKTDQNATIYIEQSDDDTNWDISDSYDYFYSKGGFGATVQAVTSYWRIRVVLTGTTATTYFRLKGILCPMVEALPRSLNSYGRLKTTTDIIDVETQIRSKVTPFGIQKTSTPTRVIGTSFTGTTKDPNFWTETVTGTGSVTQAGEITLATGTTADSTTKYQSVRKARHVAGCANEFKFTGRLITDPQTNNVRRCGVYNGTSGVDGDGFFFQVNGTTFGVGSRKGGTDTIVNSGSFNGNYGSSLNMSTSMGNFVIWYWERTAYFFVNGVLLHRIVASTASLVNTLTLPVTMENNNIGGNTTNNSFEVLVASVNRIGDLVTSPKYYHISGNAATHILKYGAGTLQKIMFNNTSGTNITIYDNTAGSGTVIGVITTTSNCIGEWTYNVPLSNGLTLVTTGNSLDATVIYE